MTSRLPSMTPSIAPMILPAIAVTSARPAPPDATSVSAATPASTLRRLLLRPLCRAQGDWATKEEAADAPRRPHERAASPVHGLDHRHLSFVGVSPLDAFRPLRRRPVNQPPARWAQAGDDMG